MLQPGREEDHEAGFGRNGEGGAEGEPGRGGEGGGRPRIAQLQPPGQRAGGIGGAGRHVVDDGPMVAGVGVDLVVVSGPADIGPGLGIEGQPEVLHPGAAGRQALRGADRVLQPAAIGRDVGPTPGQQVGTRLPAAGIASGDARLPAGAFQDQAAQPLIGRRRTLRPEGEDGRAEDEGRFAVESDVERHGLRARL